MVGNAARQRPRGAHPADIRIIPVTGEQWPADVPHRDFWLFDARELYWMRYDSAGTWLGAEYTTDPADIAEACAARDAGLAQTQPWRAFMAERPQLAARLAAAAAKAG